MYKNKPDHDSHQFAIVGSSVLASNINEYERQQNEREQKRKNFADDLKRQIEERDYIRKKEEWKASKVTGFTQHQAGWQEPNEASKQPEYKGNFSNDD